MSTNQKSESAIAINLLKEAAKREQRTKLLSAMVLLVFALVFIALFFGKNNPLSVVGLIALLFAVQFAYQYFKYLDVQQMPLFVLLKRKPQDIVWVYSVVTERMPFGFKINHNALMYFKLLDRDSICLAVPAERAEVISSGLNYLLPHATFGFSEDKEQLYMAAPEMLLRGK
ncbi:MAG: hypothetical protein AAF806_31985 [Bacteroidota bacterium]